MRTIHINKLEYKYKIGRYYIHIFLPNGKKITTNQSEVSGLTPPDLERGYWKKWFGGIKPHMIKEYIINSIIEKNND